MRIAKTAQTIPEAKTAMILTTTTTTTTITTSNFLEHEKMLRKKGQSVRAVLF